MEERYNVYFDGQVIAGHDAGDVRAKLGSVFKADQPTLDKLFSGKRQLIKRDCDAATAQKFKAAMERAGAMPIIQSSSAPAPAAPGRPMTAAEKIAALAAAPDEARYRQTPVAPATAARDDADAATGGIALTPPGTEVLRAEERAAPIVRDVDTSSLALDNSARRLSDVPPPPPPAPDTSHLSLGGVGEPIPNLAAEVAPLLLDLDGLTLSAAGSDFSDCAAPAPQAAPLDLSALSALPPGTVPVEEEQQRQRIPVPVPSTDHLALED